MNLYMRSFAAYPSMSSHGYQMGGCVGFLKTLKRLVNEFHPSRVIVAWEGGGSQRRRAIFPEYKMNRKTERLNRFYEDDIPNTEENRQHQLYALIAMIKHIPVCQLYVSDAEGDDLVAYLTCGPYASVNKIIVSSDKDMYQLLDDKTRIYNLHKKCIIDTKEVIEQFHIQPKNFALAKALCGDPGDNVPGIKGLGFKTCAKVLPFLASDEDIVLEDVINYCHSHADESKMIQRIAENAETVRRNWKLVYLNGNMLSQHQTLAVDTILNAFVPKVNRLGMVREVIKEGIGDFDVDELFYAFSEIMCKAGS